MLWGIDRDEWVQLWSGGLSAVLSAAVAAIVAIVVLTRSSRHQQSLVERQLDEQRTEAALTREKAAMADLMAAATRFISFDERYKHASVTELISAYIAATYRWALEADERDRTGKLVRCVKILGPCSFAESATGTASNSPVTAAEWGEIVSEIVGALSVFGLDWYLQSPDKRPMIWSRLEEEINDMNGRMTSLQDRLREAGDGA